MSGDGSRNSFFSECTEARVTIGLSLWSPAWFADIAVFPCFAVGASHMINALAGLGIEELYRHRNAEIPGSGP